ncbi:hypothetical protein As57867_006404, partial [Aphanomyces stellatus]
MRWKEGSVTVSAGQVDDHLAGEAAFQAVAHAIESGAPIDRALVDQCDVHRRLDNGFTLLHAASDKGHLQATELLLDYIDVNARATSERFMGRTPLEAACKMGHAAIVRRLIQAGADVNLPSQRTSALGMACQESYIEIVRILLDAGATPEYITTDIFPPLILAITSGNIEIVRLLLPIVDVHHVSFNGCTALFVASCNSGNVEILNLLLSHYDIYDEPDPMGRTPLMGASMAGYAHTVQILAQLCDVNRADESGFTALHHASENNHLEVVRALVPLANINAVDKDGLTALDLAAVNKHKATEDILKECAAVDEALAAIESNKDWGWDHRFEDDMTIFLLAARRGFVDVARRAVENGCNTMLWDKTLRTAIFLAAEYGHIDMVEYLTKNMLCDLNTGGWNNAGDSRILPYFWAVHNKYYQVVVALIGAGCMWRSHFAGQLLLEVLASHLTVDVATAMLLRDLPIKITNGKVVERVDHSFSWATFLDPSLPVHPSVRVETVRQIMHHPSFHSVANPMDVYKALTYAKDKHGRHVLHSTDTETRQVLKDLLFFCARYEILEGPPIHVSATAIVATAYDHGIFSQVFDTHANANGEMDLKGFAECSRLVLAHSCDMPNNQAEEFAIMDVSKSGNVKKVDFLRYCGQTFGGKLKVAIKFMRNGDDFEREIIARRGLDTQFVLGLTPAPTANELQQNLVTVKLNGDISVVEYPHVLVMPAADRSLHDIYEKEYLTDNKIRQMMEEVAQALQHIHGRGIAHGDLKMLNILRVGNQLKLIDLDASTDFDLLAGAKWSSGLLPPEMFYFLNNNEVAAYKQYWHGVNDQWWQKIQPKHNYVVKGFRPDKSLD